MLLAIDEFTGNVPLLLLPPANEVWGKVIFLHQFVILFKGGVCGWQGACVAKGGMCGERVVRGKGGVRGEGCVCGEGGVCMVCTTPHPPRDTAGHCAGGTHPTGMHSCLKLGPLTKMYLSF